MSEAVEGELVDQSGALVVAPPAQIVSADPTAVVEAFARYKEIQSALDRAMPDCIMNIRGKQFRKKMYWRAIATAFNLSLELVREEPVENEGGDWGWLVTYRAIATNGRHADGDGSCFATEKSAGQDSVHNVRAHAHTRAKNRAVADLVGFGEVSAEEMPPGGDGSEGGRRGNWRDALGAAPSKPGDMLPEDAVRRVRDGAAAPPKQRETPARVAKGAPPAREEGAANPAAQAFLYMPGDEAPFEPRWRQWRADPPTKNPASEYADKSWQHMLEGSYGGKRYQWCRFVLAQESAPGSTKERARCVVYAIEQKEHSRRADMAASKGEETPF
jgi:hypothetical protein